MIEHLTDPALSVVIPVFNEEKNLQLLYDRLSAVLQQMQVTYELVFVNDGSIDNSLGVLKSIAVANASVNYISLSRNFGHQVAVSAGLDAATGKAVLVMDADLQDPPELIPQLYAKMQEGFEVVYARRVYRKGESFVKKATAKFFYRLLARITHVNIPLDTGDFRIMDTKVVRVLQQMPERNKFLRGQVAWIGFRQTYINFTRDERYGGSSGYTYRKLLRLAFDGITSFSDFPLKMASMLGFIVSGGAFLLMIYTLLARLVFKDYVEGWASIILSVLFLGGVQLICIGIAGEYLARVFNNVQGRPLYVVDEQNIKAREEKEV
ncbi:glycosyltransferase family 2 protein [Pontibacter sp. KCTC 32443]|uniref:glycosyltransferase family 2 protein n=1 Tax=Pontibacter TaxID=323449 RepID=UPI00164E5638|nr:MULTISPECIES: glycosyltransferase family 2 protein [Pontibacter]MBC5775364.1 glycosyltransferase family 2 protein [Pontibacter sp. KCTC 32443]